jgi:SAM-dependent methyltransferase
MTGGPWIRWLASQPRIFDALRWLLEGGYWGHYDVIRRHLVGNGRVLDLGCGTGQYAHCFDSRQYVGVDIDPAYISAAREKHPQHRFEVHDGRSLPFADGEFDACMISGVLHHLDDAAADCVLGQAQRVIRSGGRIVIWEDIPAPWWNVVGQIIHRLDLGAYIRSPAEYRRLIERHFGVDDSKPFRSGAMDYQVFVATVPPLPRGTAATS